MVKFVTALLLWVALTAEAAVQIYWTPSTADIEGNLIDAELVLYHVWVWVDEEQGFIDYSQTMNTEFTIELAANTYEYNRCYPIYITAERTDTTMESDPSDTVVLCYDGDGIPYDGDNPPSPEEPDIINGSKLNPPVITIQVINP